MVKVKKYVKGQNTFKKEDVPSVVKQDKQQKRQVSVSNIDPFESWKERLEIKADTQEEQNKNRLVYAKKQRKKMSG